MVPGGQAPCILKVSNYKGNGWPGAWPESFTHWIQLARAAGILVEERSTGEQQLGHAKRKIILR